MTGQRSIWLAAGIIALFAVALLCWALVPREGQTPHRRSIKALNPALGLSYRYDPAAFTPAPFDANAEFALQLSGEPTGAALPRFALYGKRILGIGGLLGKAPGPLLYDFVGSQYAEEFEDNYKLTPLGEPRYEDLDLHGGLGLHQALRYTRPEGRRWPGWFPAGLAESAEAAVEGWVFFHGANLYYFYAVSGAPLTEAQREACLEVIGSLEFGAAPPAADAGEPDAGPSHEDKAPGSPGEDTEPGGNL